MMVLEIEIAALVLIRQKTFAVITAYDEIHLLFILYKAPSILSFYMFYSLCLLVNCILMYYFLYLKPYSIMLTHKSQNITRALQETKHVLILEV